MAREGRNIVGYDEIDVIKYDRNRVTKGRHDSAEGRAISVCSSAEVICSGLWAVVDETLRRDEAQRLRDICDTCAATTNALSALNGLCSKGTVEEARLPVSIPGC